MWRWPDACRRHAPRNASTRRAPTCRSRQGTRSGRLLHEQCSASSIHVPPSRSRPGARSAYLLRAPRIASSSPAPTCCSHRGAHNAGHHHAQCTASSHPAPTCCSRRGSRNALHHRVSRSALSSRPAPACCNRRDARTSNRRLALFSLDREGRCRSMPLRPLHDLQSCQWRIAVTKCTRRRHSRRSHYKRCSGFGRRGPTRARQPVYGTRERRTVARA